MKNNNYGPRILKGLGKAALVLTAPLTGNLPLKYRDKLEDYIRGPNSSSESLGSRYGGLNYSSDSALMSMYTNTLIAYPFLAIQLTKGLDAKVSAAVATSAFAYGCLEMIFRMKETGIIGKEEESRASLPGKIASLPFEYASKLNQKSRILEKK